MTYLKKRLVLSVDTLVGDETSGSLHRDCHAVTDEEQDVLGLACGRCGTDMPIGDSLLGAVVAADAVIGKVR